ncbi:MAG: efflux RND transporter permease subunit, partial [Myxococcales bacterium]
MSISSPFMHRPVATSLLAAAVWLAGMLGYHRLPVAPLPRVDFPTIQVSASLPGASPETMASVVATPLERRFGRIAGLTEMTSSSAQGQTSITLQFDIDRNVDAAARDVQAAISAAGGELPQNLPFRPTYRKVNPADAPILILALTSATLPLAQVFDTANTILAQKISQVPGVGQVFVGGGQQPAVRVQADESRLAGMGLSLADVRNALGRATVAGPKGVLVGADQSFIVGANDQLFDAEHFRSVIVASQNGAVVRLRDVARVFDDVENNRAAAWVDAKRAVLLIVRKQPGANIIDTNERVRAILPEVARSISPAIETSVALDRSRTIRASVEDVEKSLVISVVLVVLVVFVFLRSLRATLIPSVAVPLSLVGTFGVMYMLDYSLNNLSLMALTISTGFVVDDAIVVTENITRELELGHPPLEAALRGAQQVGFTIVSITASLLAVFLPILLMGGVIGKLFREFAVTLAVSVTVSAIVSLTLTPMMCSRLLRREQGEQGFFYRLSERAFDALLRAYDRGLGWVLQHRGKTLLLTLGTVALNVFLFVTIPKGLFPQQDTGLLMGFTEVAQDASFPSMVAHQESINAALAEEPDIEHVVCFVGTGPGAAVNTGTVFVVLRDRPARKATADEIITRLRPKLARIAGINTFLQAAQDVRIGGRAARTQYQYTLQDQDLVELRTWSPQMLDAMRKLPELRDVASDQQNSGLELAVRIDRDTASRLAITPQAIDDALYDAFGQRQVATTYAERNEYRVVLEVPSRMRETPDALDNVFVPSLSGAQVPLRAIARWLPRASPLAVNHQGQFPSVTLSFNLAPNIALGQAINAIGGVERKIGVPSGVLAQFSGTAQAFTASLDSEPTLIAAALLAVYIVLGVLYESYVHPVTILSTLPSAGIGALLALMLFRAELSIIAIIGVLLLIGIVKKNAIMMID